MEFRLDFCELGLLPLAGSDRRIGPSRQGLVHFLGDVGHGVGRENLIKHKAQ